MIYWYQFRQLLSAFFERLQKTETQKPSSKNSSGGKKGIKENFVN
jgi:hypothetical protein